MHSFKWVSTKLDEKKTRMWLLIGLGALVAAQIYYVQEMLAALLLFSVLFAMVGGALLVLFLLDRGCQRALAWADPRLARAARAMRRGWIVLETVSKKPLHRLRSQIAR